MQVKCYRNPWRKESRICHFCGELKGPCYSVQDLEYVDTPPKSYDFVKRSVVYELPTSKEAPTVHPANLDSGSIKLVRDPLIAGGYQVS